MRQSSGARAWVAALLGAAAALAPALVRSHGAAGEHDGPAWCGARLAVPTDAGVLVVDGTTVRTLAAPGARRLWAWSPKCDRIALAGERVAVLEVASGAATDLGLVPAGFLRAHRLDGPLPSIRFSPSGARFAVPVAGNWRNQEAVVLYTVAAGRGQLLALPRGEVHALAMLSEDTAVAAVTEGGMQSPVRLFRATTTFATAINASGYDYPRMSIAPVVIAATTPAHDAVVVDAATGAERRIAKGVGYVRAVAADGSHVLYVQNPSGSSLTVGVSAGARPARPLELPFGILADGSSPIASSSSITSVPVASWVRVWSMRRPISIPGTILPSARWAWISFCVRLHAMAVCSAWGYG